MVARCTRILVSRNLQVQLWLSQVTLDRSEPHLFIRKTGGCCYGCQRRGEERVEVQVKYKAHTEPCVVLSQR